MTRIGLGYLLRRAPVGVMGCGVAGCAAGLLMSLGPIYAASAGLRVDDVAMFMAALVGGGLLLQAPVGWLSSRIDRRALVELIGLGISGSALVCGLLPLRLEALGAMALGAFVFVLYPAALSHVHDRVERHEVVAASGTLVLAYAVGSTGAPILGAFVIHALGPRAYYPLLAALSMGLVVYTFVRLIQKKRVVPEAPAPFLATAHPVTTPATQLPPTADVEDLARD